MQSRQKHQPEVLAFLQQNFGTASWNFTLPHGWGNESYFAHSDGRAYFVKLGVQVARYQAMAALGLTPPVAAAGHLSEGTSIIVQPYIPGKSPSRKEYRIHLEQIAAILHTTHHSAELQRTLPPAPSDLYCAAGLEMATNLQQRWARYRAQVPAVADFVDDSLASLTQQVRAFQGAGLAASHNDICNANWLVTPKGKLYLIDLDSMSLDDPALDIGATLWWYYPPALRPRFLEIVGYAHDDAFQGRMRVRMALHCLHILIPREQSFDQFNPNTFEASLTDFKAILAHKENPQGYED